MMEREQTTIRLPAGLKEKLQQEAQERGVSWNSLVLKILNAEKNHQEKLHRIHAQKQRCV